MSLLQKPLPLPSIKRAETRLYLHSLLSKSMGDLLSLVLFSPLYFATNGTSALMRHFIKLIVQDTAEDLKSGRKQ